MGREFGLVAGKPQLILQKPALPSKKALAAVAEATAAAAAADQVVSG